MSTTSMLLSDFLPPHAVQQLVGELKAVGAPLRPAIEMACENLAQDAELLRSLQVFYAVTGPFEYRGGYA